MVVLIFIVVIVLVVIFRAKVIHFLENLCYKANEQSQEQTEGKGEPTIASRPSTKNNVEVSPQYNVNGHDEAELQCVDIVEAGQQNIDESHYTDLETVRKDPENIYQSLEHNRNDIAPENVQNMDDLYENFA